MRFSDEVRHQFPGLAEVFDETEAFVQRHEASLVRRFPVSRFMSLREDTQVLRHSIMRRAHLLILTQVHCVNGGLVPGLMLAARAHFEMTGLLAYLLRQTERFFATEIRRAELATTLYRLNFDRRHGLESLPSGITPDEVKAVSAVTYVDAVDRFLGLTGAFRDAYEWLSEFCHPNGYGRVIHMEITGAAVDFDNGFEEENVGAALEHGRFSRKAFSFLDDEILKAIPRLPDS